MAEQETRRVPFAHPAPSASHRSLHSLQAAPKKSPVKKALAKPAAVKKAAAAKPKAATKAAPKAAAAKPKAAAPKASAGSCRASLRCMQCCALLGPPCFYPMQHELYAPLLPRPAGEEDHHYKEGSP